MYKSKKNSRGWFLVLLWEKLYIHPPCFEASLPEHHQSLAWPVCPSPAMVVSGPFWVLFTGGGDGGFKASAIPSRFFRPPKLLKTRWHIFFTEKLKSIFSRIKKIVNMGRADVSTTSSYCFWVTINSSDMFIVFPCVTQDISLETKSFMVLYKIQIHWYCQHNSNVVYGEQKTFYTNWKVWS